MDEPPFAQDGGRQRGNNPCTLLELLARPYQDIFGRASATQGTIGELIAQGGAGAP
jgi:hypothetical protein